MTIQSAVDRIKQRIEDACLRVERDPKEIILIGVTKTVEADVMNEAFEAGIIHFGENRVQEVLRKRPDIKGQVQWHLIGHLQTNKVKQIIDQVDLIHSVDSLRLLEEIRLRSLALGKEAQVLIQLNIAEEKQKFGIESENLELLLQNVAQNEGVKINGIMTIAPFTDDPEDVRIVFKEMKEIFDALKERTLNNVEMKYLSMGMTGDFEVAIEEGANMIRVGTGIFGARAYNTK